MIKNILEMLKLDPFYGSSENVEIAKGKYKLPESFKEDLSQRKRKMMNALKNIKNG